MQNNQTPPTDKANNLIRLETEAVRIAFDPAGNLVELVSRSSGHNYAGGKPVWRLYFQTQNAMDREVTAAEAAPTVTCEDGRIELKYDRVSFEGSPLAIAVTVSVSVEGDQTHWTIDIRNDASGVTIRDCHFPLVGGLQLQDSQGLIWSKWGGERFADVREEIRRQHTLWYAEDHVFTGMKIGYPGSTAATNCYVLCDDAEGLYVGCHRKDSEFTEHQFRLYDKDLECGLARYPNLSYGENVTLGGFVLSPYTGSWHTAARKYRGWADSWFHPPEVPDWIKHFRGWQRIILKHQYGEIHYRYDQLPQIYKEGAAAGIDTLHMFGWHQGGHDNNYPNYEPDSDLGGRDALKKAVADFTASGGNVILYTNGRLIDVATDYYRDVGHRISIKDHLGIELRDAYRFRGRGNYVGNFANRTFVIACPSSQQWYEQLQHFADLAFEYGCRGIFYDQMGSGEYPCCDPTHGHGVPWMQTAQAKADILRRLRTYIKNRDPDMALGIELLSDRAAQYADYIHSQWGAAGPTGFIDWFRYTFPEVILTDRDIRDDSDIERRVNHCLLKGLRSDVEIYRCRRTISATPRYASYLKKANALRETYSDLIVAGTYHDTEGFMIDNPNVEGRAFLAGDRLAVVLTQSRSDRASTHLHVPGYRYVEHECLNGIDLQIQDYKLTVQLDRDALVAVVFEKNDPRANIR